MHTLSLSSHECTLQVHFLNLDMFIIYLSIHILKMDIIVGCCQLLASLLHDTVSPQLTAITPLLTPLLLIDLTSLPSPVSIYVSWQHNCERLKLFLAVLNRVTH